MSEQRLSDWNTCTLLSLKKLKAKSQFIEKKVKNGKLWNKNITATEQKMK